MSRHDGLSQWRATVSTHLPQLSPAHAYGLGLWIYGMVIALRAPLLRCTESTLRQRLREWCYDAKDKRGPQRRAVDVAACFA